jgi:hypothetical protein
MWPALMLSLSLSPAALPDAAIGDSIALGVGSALKVATYAKVGASSCRISASLPHTAFNHVVVSAGINDAPGLCVGDILKRIHARQIVVILPAPINSARANVAAEAAAYGALTVSYECLGGCSKRSFHPASYRALARTVRALWTLR